jgi:hypothetical protein
MELTTDTGFSLSGNYDIGTVAKARNTLATSVTLSKSYITTEASIRI